MATCYNVNDPAYIALKEFYGTDLKTSVVIDRWQRANNSDAFPSLVSAKEMTRQEEIRFNLKQKQFGEATLDNIRDKRIGSRIGGQFFINNSNPQTTAYQESFLENNLKRFYRYLEINNIPQDAFTVTRTPKSYRVDVNPGMFTATDIIEKSRSWDMPRSRQVVMHLKRLFPQINVKLLSVTEARALYAQIPNWRKTDVPFTEVNSFYYNGVAYLIKGRVTDEIAIEERLHPFIDAIKVENEELFNNLLDEAKKNFPELTQQIEQAYNKKRSFSETARDLEIVTQALTRHFKKEYETQPTKSFLDVIKKALEWFMGIIDNFNKYLTGRPLEVSDIKADTNFSDIAKLLNTEGIQFKLNKRVDGAVRYNLTPKKAKQVKDAIARAPKGSKQRATIESMFNVAQQTTDEVDSLSASAKEGGSIVVLDEKTHTYQNITDKKTYASVTTVIKGTMSPERQKEVAINLEIGNAVDQLLDSEIAGLTFEEAYEALDTDLISKEVAEKVYNDLSSTMENMRRKDSIILSQVVLFDEKAGIAGTADIVIVDRHGVIKIMDLKTTKNSLSKMVKSQDGRGLIRQYDVAYPLADDSVLKQKGLRTELSTAGQHNLQVNLYRRMAENMGYEVDYYDEWGAATIHYNVGIEGKGVDQTFNGEIAFDRFVPHPPSMFQDIIDELIPPNRNSANRRRLDEESKDDPNAVWNGKDYQDTTTESDKEDAKDYTEYNIAAGMLSDYQRALISRREAIETLKKPVFSLLSKDKEIEQISKTIAYISIAMSQGPQGQSVALAELLQDALKQIRQFKEYIEDPKNVDDPNYITYLLGFDRFKTTFEGLHSLKSFEGLNSTQVSLIATIQANLNQLGGTKSSPGIVDQQIDYFVMEMIRKYSKNDFGGDGSYFTEQDLKDIMKRVPDISDTEYQTKDMATSPDLLLATMDKIRKYQKQVLLDKIADRERMIRTTAQRLLKLDPGTKKEELFNFMLTFDEDGQFSGNYVKKIGKQYWDKQFELRAVLYDNEGNPYEYREVFDEATASAEDLAYNQDLANKRRAYSNFFRAETKDENGKLVDGEYHRYTEDFKRAREKFEFWSPGSEANEHGYWQVKPGVPPAAYAAYEAKYYDRINYTKAIRVGGQPTGAIEKDSNFMAVKPEYRQTRETSSKGEDMTSEQYRAIMNDTSALGVARKDFYEMFVDMYENDLLKKLPIGVSAQMTGRVPLVRAKFLNELQKKDGVWNKLYGSIASSRAMNTFKKTSTVKNVLLDEQGYIVDQMPVFYTGSPRVDGQMAELQKEIDYVKSQWKKGEIKTKEEYDIKIKDLNGRMLRLESSPTRGEISKDMASSLLKFSAMAENYETMGAVDDTLEAFVKVIENRTYDPPQGTGLSLMGKIKDGVRKKVGRKGNKSTQDANVVRRAKKFMSMIHYDNELVTKGAMDKIADGLIQLSSLSYVAFNPFGNFNNYLIGRLNNNIEAIGGRFYTQKSFRRATWEFNKRAIPSLVERTSYGGAEDLLDVATFGVIPGLGKSDYDPKLPNNKYEAFVDGLRMMDPMTDIREQSSATSDGKSWFARASEWGYVMQDAAEYNSQTKVGMSVLMDTMIINEETGETISYYDAFQYDTATHSNKLRPDFSQETYGDKIKIKYFRGRTETYSRKSDYELRQTIREVNKQIHGNYAKEDRVVLQSHTLGNLAIQFKKWVAPAIRARYQREYFDQNLGWMEGRYRSALSFLNYAKRELMRGNMAFREYGKGFLDAQVNAYSMEKFGTSRSFGEGGNMDQRAENKLFGFYRTMGDLTIMFSTLFTTMLFDMIITDDDDDSDFEKRMKNFTRYTAQRAYKEIVVFMPSPEGFNQVDQMLNSPIAAMRSVTEMAEFLEMFIIGNLRYTYSKVSGNEEKFLANSDYVYQRGDRKGEFKVWKNFKDVFPIVYSIQKWNSYLENDDFYIK